ncbi:helix-turn-helix transcriptional regulator [bacterium SGD-2]|nr:helix-turn-helix transcriptional regulator [bacterium SGD-2]
MSLLSGFAHVSEISSGQPVGGVSGMTGHQAGTVHDPSAATANNVAADAVLMGGLCRDFTDSTLITGNGHAMGVLKLPLTGALLVSSRHGHWVVGTGSALWLVPHTTYKVRMLGKVSLRSLYLNPASTDQLPDRSCLLRVTPLMRELISETALISGPVPDRRAQVLVAALLEEFRHNGEGMAQLNAPRDPRLVRICTHIQQHLDDNTTLQEWAEELGCDPRTLYRLFVQELGMPFVQWRQHVRLLTAVDWLSEGKPVFDVAFDLGYQNQSAFTTMFKRNMGMAPSEFVRACRQEAAAAVQVASA